MEKVLEIDNQERDVMCYIDVFSDPIIITDTKFTIIHLNNCVQARFGKKEILKEGILLTDFIIFPESDIEEKINQLDNKQEFNFEDIIEYTNKHEYRVNIRVKRFHANKQDLLSWIFIDYTNEGFASDR